MVKLAKAASKQSAQKKKAPPPPKEVEEESSEEESSEEEEAPPAKAVKKATPAKAVKNGTAAKKAESEDDDSEESEEEAPPPKKTPAKSTPAKPAPAPAKAEESDDDDDEDDEESEEEAPPPKKAAKPAKGAAKPPVKAKPAKEPSDDEDDEDDDSEEEAPPPKKATPAKPAAKAAKAKPAKDDDDDDEDDDGEDDSEEDMDTTPAQPASKAKKAGMVKAKEESEEEEEDDDEDDEEEEEDDDDETPVTPGKRKADSKKDTPPAKKAKAEGEGFCLFVGNLNSNKDFDEIKSSLRKFFSKNSLEVADVRLGGSKKFGYVEFESEEDMQKAMELNGKKLMGQELKLDRARSKDTSQEGKKERDARTLFIKNLPFSATPDDLKEIFEDAVDVRLPQGQNGSNRGIAYVEFKSEAEAEKMLDTEGGLINFEKRRKEFEVIAQIKLLQLASNNYSFTQDSHFREWFACVEKLSEAESYNLSCEIEPLSESASNTLRAKKNGGIMKRWSDRQLTEAGCSGAAGSHSKSFDHSHYRPYQGSGSGGGGGGGGGDSGDALSVTSVSSSGSDLEDVNASFLSDSPEGHERKTSTPSVKLTVSAYGREAPAADTTSTFWECTSLSSLDTSGTGSSSGSASGSSSASSSSVSSSTPLAASRSHKRSVSAVSNYSTLSLPLYNQQVDDCCIIRVSLDVENGNLYKSILVTSQDKTPAVIRKAMIKHNLEREKTEDYELMQKISEDKELRIPDNANVFYAMNSTANYDFVLKKRGFARPVRAKNVASSTLPRMKQKGLKIAKGIF